MADEEKPIRVVDRRMFTPDGELRPGFQPEEDPGSAGAAPAAPVSAAEKPKPSDTAPPASQFLALVEFFASNISAALGFDPLTGQRTGRINGAAARQMIDWLSLLEDKTRGNLSSEETDFLARMLYGLRLAYVEATAPPAK
ncbi:MAG: DUF1844 domain-containing protein [Thermoanaerobaculia bacterium]